MHATHDFNLGAAGINLLPACQHEDDDNADSALHAALQEDASLTRCNAYMLQLFARANMQVLLNVQQRKFPKDLFKVRMYVLKHSDL